MFGTAAYLASHQCSEIASFKMFCDSLITLSPRQPLLRMVLRSFSRRLTLADLVSSGEVSSSSLSVPDLKGISAEVFVFGCDCTG